MEDRESLGDHVPAIAPVLVAQDEPFGGLHLLEISMALEVRLEFCATDLASRVSGSVAEGGNVGGMMCIGR